MNISTHFRRERKKYLFCGLMLALPILQFCIFYIAVNINSILMAFQKYDLNTGEYAYLENIFGNFKEVFLALRVDEKLIAAWKNSTFSFVSTLFFGMFCSLTFSYYIYRKRFLSVFFRIMLFAPSIVSMIVLSTIFRYFDFRGYPEFIEILTGETVKPLLERGNSFYVIQFFCIFCSMGTQMLTFSGTMSGISDSITEAATLDGFSHLQEFFYIVIPMIWPTIITFVTIGVSGFFTQQVGLFSFYGASAMPTDYTFGYYLYLNVQQATTYSYFPQLAAMGLMFTFVTMPVVFVTRWSMRRFGPSAD